MAKLIALLVMATPTPAPARWVLSGGVGGLACSQLCEQVGAECDATKFQTANDEGFETEEKFAEVMRAEVVTILDGENGKGDVYCSTDTPSPEGQAPMAPWFDPEKAACFLQPGFVSCEGSVGQYQTRLCWCTPPPPPPCLGRQCKRAHTWWKAFLSKKVKPSVHKFMRGFLDKDSCFAQCIDDNKKFAMVIEAHKDCPSKVNTRRSTKMFGKLALQPKEFCNHQNLRVCSYCLHIPSFGKQQVTIVKFKQSTLKKPEVCSLEDEGFPNTPCESEEKRV
jgi:hypothetical protein